MPQADAQHVCKKHSVFVLPFKWKSWWGSSPPVCFQKKKKVQLANSDQTKVV
jgi:hypothetical protein